MQPTLIVRSIKKGLQAVLLPVVFAVPVQVANAQSNILKVNVLSPVVKTGSLFFEHAFSRKSSAQIGLFYTGMSYKDTRAQGFGLTPEYRWYFSDKQQSPRGFYVAAYFRVQDLHLRTDWSYSRFSTDPITGVETRTDITEEADADLNTLGGGLLFGRQIILKEKITIDLFAGPGYDHGDLEVNYGPEELFETRPWKGITARFGVALGINF